jgi:hypothetical protein
VVNSTAENHTQLADDDLMAVTGKTTFLSLYIWVIYNINPSSGSRHYKGKVIVCLRHAIKMDQTTVAKRMFQSK